MPLLPSICNPLEKTLVYKEVSGVDGNPPRKFIVTDFEIRPLGFNELAALNGELKVTIPFEIRNARIRSADGVLDNTIYSLSTTLESHFTSKAIGLVKGGWLPSTLGAYQSDYTFLVDRNIISEIVGRFENGNLLSRKPDFLDLFSDEPVRINPLLYVLEGNSRTTPTPQQVIVQFNEVVEKLQKALPRAILDIGPRSIDSVLGIIEDTRAGMGCREKFLLRLAPWLQSPIGRANVDRKWEEVLGAADDFSIPRKSSVVLAALSAVCITGGRSPAKQLLKFKPAYSPEDAYNALADLRSLDVFAGLLSHFPNENMQLCTADKNLALFWAGIRASNFRKVSSSCTFEIDPVSELIPDQFRDRWLNDINHE